jgi:hypothetical protein
MSEVGKAEGVRGSGRLRAGDLVGAMQITLGCWRTRMVRDACSKGEFWRGR